MFPGGEAEKIALSFVIKNSAQTRMIMFHNILIYTQLGKELKNACTEMAMNTTNLQ